MSDDIRQPSEGTGTPNPSEACSTHACFAKERICAELEYDGDDWLDVACDHIRKRLATLAFTRTYDTSTVGGRLKCARECAGLLQRELARRVKMTQLHISESERGKRALPAIKVPGICLSLGIKVPWLLIGEGDGGPKVAYRILRKGQTVKELRKLKGYERIQAAVAEARARNAARKAPTSPVRESTDGSGPSG